MKDYTDHKNEKNPEKIKAYREEAAKIAAANLKERQQIEAGKTDPMRLYELVPIEQEACVKITGFDLSYPEIERHMREGLPPNKPKPAPSVDE